jgi:hypothetical protein
MKKILILIREGNASMTIGDFTIKFGLRLKKVVDSCRNEPELDSAENYVRNGLKSYVKDLQPEIAEEYVRIFITPKRQELTMIELVEGI